jgi:hypothetical protein
MSTGVMAVRREGLVNGLVGGLFRGLFTQYIYFSMSLLIAAVVIYGFSHTIDSNLIHAVPVRPWILYLHATAFSGWVAFFILQSALVRTRNVRAHRTLGWFGVAMGAGMPVLGVATALSMARFRFFKFHEAGAPPFLAIQFWDMICFTSLFVLAIYWRRKPELHRRLILIASCGLTAAAFARFPLASLLTQWRPPAAVGYAGADLLILFGVLRDLMVARRAHRIYLYALPILILGQSLAVYLAFGMPSYWVKITGWLVQSA